MKKLLIVGIILICILAITNLSYAITCNFNTNQVADANYKNLNTQEETRIHNREDCIY